MAYFKIGTKEDELSFYVSADERGLAVRVVEDLIGPINPAQLIVKQVRAEDVPEDAEVLE